jgi:Icc-related predicted phosphoesterase
LSLVKNKKGDHSMRILFIGDIHGNFRFLENMVSRIPEKAVDYIIQVGDFGLWPQNVKQWKRLQHKIYFIDGNHEYFPLLPTPVNPEPVEILGGLVYLPRGTIMKIGSCRIGFLGGAESVDRMYRTEGVDWFRQEAISYKDMMHFSDVGELDILVTHTPPATVVATRFQKDPLPSAKAVEQVWLEVGRPLLICGHMHERVTVGNIHVLDECGILFLDL